jgi:hypothetical protein
VTGTVISPDGRWVVVRGPDGEPSLHPLDGGHPREVRGLDQSDRALRFSSDGRFQYHQSLEELYLAEGLR